MAGVGVKRLDARDWGVDSTVLDSIGKKCPKLEHLCISGAHVSRPLLPPCLRRLAYLEFVRPDPRCNLQPGCFAALAGGGVNSALII